MKYFTPDLYVRYNSESQQESDRAEREWEDAIHGYQKHLKQISRRLTPSAKQLARTLCLHDAYYLGLALPHIPDRDNGVAVLMLRQDKRDTFLVYLLAEEPLIQETQATWPSPTAEVHWLYDEFDVVNNIQQHEILLSNGRVLTLRFREMQSIQHDYSEQVAIA